MSKNGPFRIPETWAGVNWFKGMLLGSCIWPVIFLLQNADATDEYRLGILLNYLMLLCVSGAMSLVITIPAMLLLLMAGSVFNRRNLPFGRYCLLQNAAHVTIAAATFFTLKHYSGPLGFPGELLLTIAAVYTASGLLVWNKMYYDLQKQTTTKIT